MCSQSIELHTDGKFVMQFKQYQSKKRPKTQNLYLIFVLYCTFNFNQKIYLNSCLRNAIGNLDQKCKYPSEDFVYRWYPFMLDGCGGKIWNMTARDFYECQTSSLKSSPSVLVCRYYSIDFGLVGRLCGFKSLFCLHELTWH